MKTRFQLNERVSREINVFAPEQGLRYGNVIEIYSVPKKDYGNGLVLGPYPELYKVRFDDGSVEGGFLPHGLNKEVRIYGR